MNKKIMQKWVKALRSGTYAQATDTLVTNDDRFCCLGVLCNLAAEDGQGEWVPRDNTWAFQAKYTSDTSALPDDIKYWADMGSNDGTLKDFHKSLAEMNDAGKTFLEIADIIEDNWEEL